MTENMKWIRAPKSSYISDERIEIVTEPHTDLWQRTYYHFRNDNAPVLQIETDEQYFSFMVKTDFTDSHRRFDQCGVVMYLDSENWLKASVEYENIVLLILNLKSASQFECDCKYKNLHNIAKKMDKTQKECASALTNPKRIRRIVLNVKMIHSINLREASA